MPEVCGRSGGTSRGTMLQGLSAELIGRWASLADLMLTEGGMATAAIPASSARLGGLEFRIGAIGPRQARLKGWIEGSGLFRLPVLSPEAPPAGSGD